MPTYAYTCRDCGRALEAHQDFSDASLTVCPVCGGHLRKQYGSVGVTFNGSGFYRNDSRAESAHDAASNKSGSGSGESGSSPAKTETKSDATPAAKPAESKLASAASTASTASKSSTKSD